MLLSLVCNPPYTESSALCVSLQPRPQSIAVLTHLAGRVLLFAAPGALTLGSPKNPHSFPGPLAAGQVWARLALKASAPGSALMKQDSGVGGGGERRPSAGWQCRGWLPSVCPILCRKGPVEAAAVATLPLPGAPSSVAASASPRSRACLPANWPVRLPGARALLVILSPRSHNVAAAFLLLVGKGHLGPLV